MPDPWDAFPLVESASPSAQATDPWAAFPIVELAQPAAASVATEPTSTFGKVLRGADRAGGVFLRGARRGVANLAGFPVDAVNAGLGLVGAGSKSPVMGSDFIDTILGAPAAVASGVTGGEFTSEGPTPENAFERIVGRVGNEIGASAVPVGAALTAGRAIGVPAARAMAETGPSVVSRLLGQAAHAGAVNPGGLAARELGYGVAAGTGAGLVNEAVGAPQQGDNFWSDFLGSLAGVGAGAGLATAGKAAKELFSPVVGGERYFSDVAGENVAGRILDNSTQFQSSSVPADRFDTTDLVSALKRPAAVEEAVPGYQVNIGDKTGDPGLQAFAFNVDGKSPGRAHARRVANELAIDDRVAELAPTGDPALFRDALERGRTQQLAAVDQASQTAQAEFDRLYQTLAPVMHESSARGSQARAVLAEAYERAQDATRDAYAQVRDREALVPIDDLAERFRSVEDALPLNDRQRFLPSEAGVPRTLAGAAEEAAEASVPPPGTVTPRRAEAEGLWSRLTGGAEPPRAETGPAPTDVPFNEVMSIRSGLTDDVRGHRAAGKMQAARIADQFRTSVDDFIETNLPSGLRESYETARATRRSQADRFERPGTGLGDILKTREGGGYQLDDSAVPRRILQRDTGKLSDFQAAMREGGNDTRLVEALEDEMLADVRRRGLAENPMALLRYMQDYGEVFNVFPRIRQQLIDMAGARNAATAAADTAAATRAELTTPSRSPVAAYLQHGDAATKQAMQGVVTSKDPAAAARQLVEAAGGDPAALNNARGAFWSLVTGKRYKAAGVTGNKRWDAGAVQKMFEDPKTDAVARELWADNPQELADIKELFTAVAGAEGSSRARAAGSSGTGQIVGEKFDPNLSGATVSSRIRSVKEGRTSLPYFTTSLAGDLLRRYRLAGKKDAVEKMMAEAVNNPGLAAELLAKHNPADFAAKRRMLTQKYGQRITSLFTALDEDDDPVVGAAAAK